MTNISLIVAMQSELPSMVKDGVGIYHLGNINIKVTISGIGPNKARRAARQVCLQTPGFRPDWLINVGFGGAASSELDIGQLIIADRLAYRNREIQLKKTPVEKLADLLVESNCRVGKLQSFNRPVLSRKRVSGDTLAVDMESFAIAQTAARYQIPAIFIKAVSDILPERAGLFSLIKLFRSLKINAQRAWVELDVAVKKIVESRQLFE